MVAPVVSPSHAASAIASACASPGGCVMPSPITRPSLTTHGPDDRVRTGLPARAAGQLDGPLKVSRVALCGRGLGHSEALPEPVDSRVNDTSGRGLSQRG